MAEAARNDGPTTEIGHPGSVVGTGITSVLLDFDAEVKALGWPTSVYTYEKMRRDSQIAALYNGLTIPIRKFPWAIDRNGARDEVVENFSYDVGLPVLGEDPDTPIGRRRNRFTHDDHLAHALLAALYGFMFFEQYGEYDESTRGTTGDIATDMPLWRLKRLSPRMPKTISEVKIAEDGGLVSIKQYGSRKAGSMISPPIPVSQLVAYVWGKEGANWFGRPLLHSIYRDWLIKDRLVRVDAIKHERTGAGVPIIEAAPGASPVEIQRLDAMAQKYKVGEASGGAIPANTRFRLVGVEGATSDVLASIRYYDERMAGAFFSEVKTLGQSAYGSRSLGDTFSPFLLQAQESMAEWYSRTFNEHVIEDWVDINYGEDEPAPRLVWEDPNAATPDTPGTPETNTANAAAVELAAATLRSTEPIAQMAVAGKVSLDQESADALANARDRAWAILKAANA